MTDRPVVILYSKPGCHLCEQTEEVLGQLRPRWPHTLRAVDITREPALEERYGLRIPVVDIGGREYAAPLGRSVLERALARLPQ